MEDTLSSNAVAEQPVVTAQADAAAAAPEAAKEVAAAAAAETKAPVIGTLSAPTPGVEIVRGSQRIPVIGEEAVIIGDRIVVPDSTQANMVFAAPAAGEEQVTAVLKGGTDATIGWRQGDGGVQEVSVDVAAGDMVVNASDATADTSKLIVKKPVAAAAAFGDLGLAALGALALLGLASRGGDDDNNVVPPPSSGPQFSVTHSPASVNEGQGVVFTVTRTGDTSGSQTVNFTAAGAAVGNAKAATAGTDFAPANGSVTFAPGETSKTFTVDALSDNNGNEGAEAFTVTSTVDGKTVDSQSVVINDVAPPNPGVPLLDPTQVLLGQLPSQAGSGALTPVLAAAAPVLDLVSSVSDVVNAATAPLLGSNFKPENTGFLDPVDSLGANVVTTLVKPLDPVLTPLVGDTAAEKATVALINQVDFVTDGVQNLLGNNPVTNLGTSAGVNMSPEQFNPLLSQVQSASPISTTGGLVGAASPLGALTGLL